MLKKLTALALAFALATPAALVMTTTQAAAGGVCWWQYDVDDDDGWGDNWIEVEIEGCFIDGQLSEYNTDADFDTDSDFFIDRVRQYFDLTGDTASYRMKMTFCMYEYPSVCEELDAKAKISE